MAANRYESAFSSRYASPENKAILIPSKYIGRCVEQVESFLKNDVEPFLADMDSPVKAGLSV